MKAIICHTLPGQNHMIAQTSFCQVSSNYTTLLTYVVCAWCSQQVLCGVPTVISVVEKLMCA